MRIPAATTATASIDFDSSDGGKVRALIQRSKKTCSSINRTDEAFPRFGMFVKIMPSIIAIQCRHWATARHSILLPLFDLLPPGAIEQWCTWNQEWALRYWLPVVQNNATGRQAKISV